MNAKSLVLSLLLGSYGIAPAKNPIMRGADPHVMFMDGTFWMYPTRSKGGEKFFAYESKDLVRWKEDGPILDFKSVAWIRNDQRKYHGAWAPCIAVKDKRYYFYYSVGPQSPGNPSRIGVATGDSPQGPFKDSGKLLLTGGDGFEAIDPMVFEDPASKRFYFYAGGSAGAKLRMFEMKEDMTNFAREIEVDTPREFTEGAFVHFHEGLYHMTYSHGSYENTTYSVHYSTSEKPDGPWKYRGVILQSNDKHKGPGHHSFFQDTKGDWFIAYHRWNNRKGAGPYTGEREIAIDRVLYKDGLLQPVVMTDEGVNLAFR